MRNVFLTLLFASALCACTHNDGYTVNGTLKGDAENARVSLIDIQNGHNDTINSTTVKDGHFTLSGKVDAPGMYAVIIDTNAPHAEPPDHRNKTFKVNFYLENSDITFEGDVATFPTYYYNPERTGKPTITGSATNDLYEKFKESISDVSARLKEIDRLYSTEYIIPELDGQDASARGIELVKLEKSLSKTKDDATWRFITENPSSIVAFDEAAYIISGFIDVPTSARIDSLIDILRPHWEGTPRFGKLLSDAATSRRLAIGEPYLDLRLLNAEGDTVALSSLIPDDKFTMLEFWASWCGPCRAEIPHLAKVHKKYPDFNIISISVDADDAEWRKAMKEENMVWTQLRNPEGMDGDVKDKYNIYMVCPHA